MSDLDPATLTGCSRSAIVYSECCQCDLHCQVQEPLQQLQQLALSSGQELKVASAYRDFDRQLLIWNAKVSGQRPVLDKQGSVLNLSALTDWEIVEAILTWSALPGASRHHWGTDFDVYNPQLLLNDYQLQLTRDEYETGVQSSFNNWLSQILSSGETAFYRPFAEDKGGVSPEPWHISYRPLADQFQAALTIDLLADTIRDADLQLKGCVLDHLDEIYSRFVLV